MKLKFWMWVEVHESNKYCLEASDGFGQGCLGMLSYDKS